MLHDTVGSLRAFVHSQSDSTTNQTIVTLNYEWKHRQTLKATGVGRSQQEAFLKAISELGESIVMYEYALPDRSGMAGGLFERTAIRRASWELLEHDSFLFHYRTKAPFVRVEELNYKNTSNARILAFKMELTESKAIGAMVTDYDCAKGNSECLIFGTGCAATWSSAAAKAL